MIYVVGDSNSVYTSPYLLSHHVDTSMCKVGWTTEDVLKSVKRKNDLSDAKCFLVFVGLNDSSTGEMIASNVLQIVSVLRIRRSSVHVPIFLAVPFCVRETTPESVCFHRRDAAVRLERELKQDGMGSVVVRSHVTREGYVKKMFEATKRGSTLTDPLHLNPCGYKAVANLVNDAMRVNVSSKRNRP